MTGEGEEAPKRPRIKFRKKALAAKRAAKRAAEGKTPRPKAEKRRPAPSDRRVQGLELYPVSKKKDEGGLTDTARRMVAEMVWSGLTRTQAVDKIGITRNYGYQLLRRPEVMEHYRAEVDVLRNSGKARLVHRLEALSEQDASPTAAVRAAQVLLSLDGEADRRPSSVTVNVTAGYVIDCSAAFSRGQQPPRLSVPEPKALMRNDVVDEAPPRARQIVAPASAKRPEPSPIDWQRRADEDD